MLKASQASHKGRKVWILFTKKILSFLKEFQITKKKKKLQHWQIWVHVWGEAKSNTDIQDACPSNVKLGLQLLEMLMFYKENINRNVIVWGEGLFLDVFNAGLL